MQVPNKEVYWSKFADDFEERNNYVVGVKNLELVFKKISEQSKFGEVLELGCGNGTFSKKLEPISESIISSDFSEEMVESSKVRLKEYKKIEVRKENCFDLTFEQERFDTVFMANLLHIIPTPEKALEETYRVLKKGGRVVIVSYTSENMRFLDKLRLMRRYKKTYGKPSETTYTLTQELAKEMVADQGFKIESCELVGHDMKAVFLIAKKY